MVDVNINVSIMEVGSSVSARQDMNSRETEDHVEVNMVLNYIMMLIFSHG